MSCYKLLIRLYNPNNKEASGRVYRGLASSSALGISRSNGFVPNSYSSSSWSKSDWYNASQSWNQMLSETHLSPYGLMKALTNIDNETNETIEDITKKMGKKARYRDWETDRKSTRLNSSHITRSRMPSSA